MAKPATPREIDIQAGFRNRLRYVAPAVSMVAIPNAGKRSQWAAAQAKKEGLATGFPDCMCIWPDAGVCFIEFKSAAGRLSDNQVEWIGRLDARGHKVTVARSVEEALAFLRACGAPVMEQIPNQNGPSNAANAARSFTTPKGPAR